MIGAMKVEGLTLIENFNRESGDQDFYERIVELLNLGAVDIHTLLLSLIANSDMDIVELRIFKRLIDRAYDSDDMVTSLRGVIRELLTRRNESSHIFYLNQIFDDVRGNARQSSEEIKNELLRYAFIIDDRETEHLVVLLLGIGAQPDKKESLYRLLCEAKLLPENAIKMMTCVRAYRRWKGNPVTCEN